MKRYLYLLLILFLLLNCKKEREPAPLPAIKEIVGKWRLDAVEKTVNGQKVWEKAISNSSSYLTFRFDGLLLDEKGLSWCCSPDTLVVNGTSFKIKPRAKAPENPQCAYIDCFTCSSWDLEQKGNELIVTLACQSINSRQRYLRD